MGAGNQREWSLPNVLAVAWFVGAVAYGIAEPPSRVFGAEQPSAAQAQCIWLARLEEQLGQISAEEERRDAALSAVIQLAEMKQVPRAASLIEKELRGSSKYWSAYYCVAAAQSANGDLAGALRSIRKAPDEPSRQTALAIVAIRQAQRGNVAGARDLLAGITVQHQRDRVNRSVAEAQAKAGDEQAAKVTSDGIVEDDLRNDARKAIKAAKARLFVLDEIPSPFLSGHLAALVAFSGDEEWKRSSISALAAAYREDEKAFAAKATSANDSVQRLPKGLERATGLVILALAHHERGELEKASKLLDQAVDASSGDIVGISSLFGRPIVVYTLIRMGKYDCIESSIRRFESSDDLRRVFSSQELEAVGTALAEKGDMERLESAYQGLKDPVGRLHLAIGTLRGMERDSSSHPGDPSKVTE